MRIALILPFSDFQIFAYLGWFNRFFKSVWHSFNFFTSWCPILNYWFLIYCLLYLKIRLDCLTSSAKLLSFAYCEQHTRIIVRIRSFTVLNKQLYLCFMPTELTAATKNPQSCNTVLFPTKALAFLLNRIIFYFLLLR